VALEPGADGTVMATMSPAALLVLVALFAVRQAGGRPELLGRDAALLAADAAMLMMLAMLLTQQWLVWRRVKALSLPA
jgi:hypothetical protein